MLWVRFLFIVAHVIIPHKGSSKEMESNFEIKISLYISGTNTTLTIYVIHFNVIGIITIVWESWILTSIGRLKRLFFTR